MSEVLHKIKIIIAEKLAIDEAFILPEASFKDDFGADSLDVVELLVEFEKIFELIIPDEQLDKITTVGSAVSFIESALEEKVKPVQKN